jgi:putative heme-binding domain-containing protein
MYQLVLDDHYQRRNRNYAAPNGRVDVPEVAGNAPVFPVSVLLARFNDLNTANRFTSACSAIIYRDDLFGPAFAGNMFVSEPVHNLVHREVVTPQGALFKSRRAADERESEFLASSDNWFRPTMIQTGPDGALWIADMYRHVIEHPQWIPDTFQKKLDLQAGFDQGRLYRVYPVDKEPRAIPRLDKLDTAGLVAALDSPSGWQRDTAQQLIIERFAPGNAPPRSVREITQCVLLLEKQGRESKNPLCRLHALCTLGGLAHPSASLLLHALGDENAAVRRHAVRLCESLPELPPELMGALVKLIDDADPHVRMQLAYTLGEIKTLRAGFALGELLSSAGGDRWLFAAGMSSLSNANIEPVLTAVLRGGDRAAPNMNLLETLLNQAASFGNANAFRKLLATVAAPRDGRFETWQLTAIGTLLDTLERKRETLSDLHTSKDEVLQAALGDVSLLFGFARNAVGDETAPAETRLAAVGLLGRGVDQQDADRQKLAALLTPQSPPALQAAAVASLGRLRDAQVAGALLAAWRGYGPARRSQVLDILLSRDAWTEALLAAVESKDVASADFDAVRRQRLVGHRTQTIRERAATLLAVAASADRQKVLDQFRPTLALAGDAQRGAQVFAKACAQCHKLAGAGHEVGPDLASLTDKSPEAMLVAILDPNRAVENKFLSYVATTTAGLTFNGLLAVETGNSITLRGPETKEQTILRSDLEELTSTAKSAMPEGLEKDLRPEDLADLIAYVRANVPLPRPKEFAGNKPELVRAAADGTLLLTSANCEIHGSTLIFEPQNANLGYWANADDYAQWTIDVPAAGKFRVEFHFSCDPSVANNPWRLEGPAGVLAGRTTSTGNWETYRESAVGEITLAQGEQQLALRPVGRPQGALVDLKSIRLTPVK